MLSQQVLPPEAGYEEAGYSGILPVRFISVNPLSEAMPARVMGNNPRNPPSARRGSDIEHRRNSYVSARGRSESRESSVSVDQLRFEEKILNACT